MRRLTLVVAMTILSAPAGCMDPAESAPAEAPVESNILGIRKFFSISPWLSSVSDGSGRINGVRITVYLEGPSKPKGVFGTGTLVVTMYRLDRDTQGREVATQVFEKSFPPEETYLWQCRKETALGWGYGLRLFWGDDLDVAGRQVAFVIRYVREDGRVITSSRQVLMVPLIGAAALTIND